MRMVSTGTLAALARLQMVNEFASSDICLDSVVDYGFKVSLSNLYQGCQKTIPLRGIGKAAGNGLRDSMKRLNLNG